MQSGKVKIIGIGSGSASIQSESGKREFENDAEAKCAICRWQSLSNELRWNVSQGGKSGLIVRCLLFRFVLAKNARRKVLTHARTIPRRLLERDYKRKHRSDRVEKHLLCDTLSSFSAPFPFRFRSVRITLSTWRWVPATLITRLKLKLWALIGLVKKNGKKENKLNLSLWTKRTRQKVLLHFLFFWKNCNVWWTMIRYPSYLFSWIVSPILPMLYSWVKQGYAVNHFFPSPSVLLPKGTNIKDIYLRTSGTGIFRKIAGLIDLSL